LLPAEVTTMSTDPEHPDVLLSVTNEIEATAIVTALADYDVKAITVGGYTSGFKAEAPGNIAVVVKREDFDRARQAMTEIQEDQGQIDWSNVDVMESVDAPTADQEEGNAQPANRMNVRQFWWAVEMIGVLVCFIIWLFTRQLTPMLIYIATGLVLIGLFLALSPFAARPK
jgi:Flp pilus assembly protein TadB